MSWMGSVLTEAINLDASSTNIPASGSNSAELDASLAKEVSSIMIQTNVAAPFYLTIGAAGAEENWLLIDGYASTTTVLPRMPIYASKGVRLGIRAFANSAITAGSVTINLWS